MSQQLLSPHKHKRPHHPESKWSHYTNNDNNKNSGGKAAHMQKQLPGQGVHCKMSPLYDQTNSVTLDSRSSMTVGQQPPLPLLSTSASSSEMSAVTARSGVFADDTSTPPLTPIISNARATAAITGEADNRDGAPAKSADISGNHLLCRRSSANVSGFRYPNNTHHPLSNPSATMYRSYPPITNSNNGRYYQQPLVDYQHSYYMSSQHLPQPPYNAHNSSLTNVMPATSSLMAGQYPANANGLFPVHGRNNGVRQLTAEEKELKRKISHSAIEKRRRERTNAVLRDLQDIIPGLSKSSKIQKLEILEAAADYIRHLATTTTSKVTKTKQRRSSIPRRHHCHSRMCCDKQQSYSSSVSQSESDDESSKHDTTIPRAMSLDDEGDQESPKQPNVPMSIASTTSSNDDNDNEDELSPPSGQDPTSMKVNFLLC